MITLMDWIARSHRTDDMVKETSTITSSSLVKKTDYNTKITKIEGKIPNTSGLVKKTDYNTKIIEIEGKILMLVI